MTRWVDNYVARQLGRQLNGQTDREWTNKLIIDTWRVERNNQ